MRILTLMALIALLTSCRNYVRVNEPLAFGSIGPLPEELVQAPDVASAPPRFWVFRDHDSKDNRGIWSNYMPAEAGTMMTVDLESDADPHSGSDAVRIDMKWKQPNWCGVAVASQDKYWGETPSQNAFDLSGATKLVFFARGQVGGEYIEVKSAICGDKPYGDSASKPFESGWIRLSKEWKRYEIALETEVRGEDQRVRRSTGIRRCITPFVVVSNREKNGDRDISFELDDVYFELSPTR